MRSSYNSSTGSWATSTSTIISLGKEQKKNAAAVIKSRHGTHHPSLGTERTIPYLHKNLKCNPNRPAQGLSTCAWVAHALQPSFLSSRFPFHARNEVDRADGQHRPEAENNYEVRGTSYQQYGGLCQSEPTLKKKNKHPPHAYSLF